MKTFNDESGRTWEIAINVDCIKRVRALLDVDLLTAVDGDMVPRLTADPILLCDVLYAIIKPQADKLGVSDEDFGRAMAGDAIDHATEAMLAELVNFFPPRRRAPLAKAMETFAATQQAMADRAIKRLESPQMAAYIQRAMDKADAEIASMLASAGESSGASPATSA